MMIQDLRAIEKIQQRSLINETSHVNDFIRDLKVAGANPGMTMNILAEKLGVNLSESKELVFNSPSWEHLYPGDNPFTQEFLKMAAADADSDDVHTVDGKIVSVRIDLNKDKDSDA